MFFLGGFTTQAQVNSSDSLALVDLYNNTTGTGWINQTNWLTTAPVSTWYGVGLMSTRVTNINLGNNNLNGGIPASLGNLSSLQDLNLGQNQLSGGLPPALANLVVLQSLDLHQNQLSGAIPSALEKLFSLQSLNLSQNQFTGGIPSTLGDISNLQSLNLSQNQLGGIIPSSLGSLANLTDLELENDQLTGGMPSSFGNLAKLQVLLLDNNQLANAIPALPVSLGGSHPHYTSRLLLQNNQFNFSGMESLPQADVLQYAPQATLRLLKNGRLLSVAAGGAPGNDTFRLYLNNVLTTTQVGDSVFTTNKAGSYYIKVVNTQANQLVLRSDTAVITSTEKDSLALVALYDSTNGPGWKNHANWLTSSPLSAWYGVTVVKGRVTGLQLSWNNLAGHIPPPTGDLDSLQKLDLGNNKLSGTIPGTLSGLVNLTYLNFAVNQLSGIIPAFLGNLNSLTYLGVSSNKLGGNIPSSFGNLSNVTSLDLRDNQLTGSIPASLSNLLSVTVISLSYNQLSGSIPASLGKLSSLVEFDCSFNQLSGSIPDSFTNLTNLQTCYFDHNQITGIPASMGGLVKLKGLDLSYNLLSGSAPSSLGNLANLQRLNINNNHLNGAVPPFLTNLHKLQYLDLSYNQLSGGIPSDLGNLASLLQINLTGNQLTGNIPSSFFTGLSNLQFLVLSQNQLSGKMPIQLGNLSNLQGLDLSQNQFTGSIPAELTNLKNLMHLDLSKNQLTGNIPDFSQASFMEYFDLSYNQLSGAVPHLSFIYNWNSPTQNPVYNYINISNNRFTFNGMQQFSTGVIQGNDTMLHYAPQLPVPLFQNGTKLFVSIGGEPQTDTFRLYKNGVLLNTQPGDSVFTIDGSSGRYNITVTNWFATQLTLTSDTLNINSDSTILSAKPTVEYATYEYTDTLGWTHYYYDNHTPNDLTDDTLLLSLKKNGQDIGTIGDGTFAVKLVATAGAGSNTGIQLTNPLITNPTGYWVMNRYWQVTATNEPATNVGVRFYYNNQDLKDVNGSYPSHNLTNSNLIFYKNVGGNPDPISNLAGASRLISIVPGTFASDTSWTYHVLSDTTQYGEYSVASFSGGGGGGTGNNQALPVVLVNFTANLAKNDVQLKWQTAQEINAGYYTVERSLTGRDYSVVGRINAAGNSTIAQTYKLTDYGAALPGNGTLYYRLKITDKNGYITYSKVIAVNIAGGISGMLVYPNPARNTATVMFSASIASKFVVELTDFSGKIIKRIEGLSAVGTNNVTVDLRGYPQGTYLITINGNNIKKQNITLLKQ